VAFFFFPTPEAVLFFSLSPLLEDLPAFTFVFFKTWRLAKMDHEMSIKRQALPIEHTACCPVSFVFFGSFEFYFLGQGNTMCDI